MTLESIILRASKYDLTSVISVKIADPFEVTFWADVGVTRNPNITKFRRMRMKINFREITKAKSIPT